MKTPKQNASAGRGWRATLMLSLALNLLFLGVFAGSALRVWQARPAHGPAHEMRALWQALPDDSRATLRDQFRVRRAQRGAEAPSATGTGGTGADREEIPGRLSHLLRHEPFDPDAFSEALDSMRMARAARAAESQAALVAQIGALSVAERAAMADRLNDRLNRRPRLGQRR